MAEYISSFITGFEGVAARQIPRELGRAKIIKVYDGLAHYAYAGSHSDVARMPFVNNSFVIYMTCRGGGLTFDKMVKEASGKAFRQAGGFRSFRVRFSRENEFEKVSGAVMALAERAIIQNCGMRADRVNPETEFWYIIRREGVGFFGQLLKKRGAANLKKGELRPELACLLCLERGLGKTSVVCDPFAGYGSIPLYILNSGLFSTLYVNDCDESCAAYLRGTPLGRDPRVVLTRADAARLTHVGDGAVDAVITDPPWGFVNRYDDIAGFYLRALLELRRIIKSSGQIALLTGRPEEMAEAAGRASLDVASRLNILVNGKKAGVITLTK